MDGEKRGMQSDKKTLLDIKEDDGGMTQTEDRVSSFKIHELFILDGNFSKDLIAFVRDVECKVNTTSMPSNSRHLSIAFDNLSRSFRHFNSTFRPMWMMNM